jgi:hypothetical protein
MRDIMNVEDRRHELDDMLDDPVLRLVLERRYYEITKSTRPQSDNDLVKTILDAESRPHT